jgi:phospholipid/cholesterol/gamma-HCH transport system substrate-binding protein
MAPRLWVGKASSIATVTDTLQELLTQAKAENLIPNAAASIEQIDATAKSFEDLTVQLQAELSKVDPVLRNLQAANGPRQQHCGVVGQPGNIVEFATNGVECGRAHRQIGCRGR